MRESRAERKATKEAIKRRECKTEIMELMARKGLNDEDLNAIIKEVYPEKELRSLSSEEAAIIKKALIEENPKYRLENLRSMKILKIPIVCIRLLIIIVPWILIIVIPFIIITIIITQGIMTLLSGFGFPNWKFYIGEAVWYVGEAVAVFGAIAGTILIFMGYRHLKLLFSVDRDELIYELEEEFNLLRKLKQLKKKKPIEPFKEHSLDCMISNLTEVLSKGREKRGVYDDFPIKDIDTYDKTNGSEYKKELAEKPYVKKLLSLGLEKELLTSDEINEVLLSHFVSSDELDEIVLLLEEFDIEIGI